MDDPDIDPELDKLLQDLENADAESKKFPVPPPKLQESSQHPPKVEAPKPVAPKPTEVVPHVEQSKELKAKDPIVYSEVVEAVDENDSLKIQQEIRTQVIGLITDVIDTCSTDRKEVQSVINFLREKAEFDDSIKDSVVEQLVQSLKTKNEINDTAVRAIDSMIKLLGIEKKGATTKNTNNFHMTPDQLKDLLNE